MGVSNYLPSSRLIAPGVCTSTTRPASPFEGQVIYETDTDNTLIWNGSAWRYLTTGQSVVPGSWTTFTPSWSNFTPGNATVSAKYALLNKMMWVKVAVTLGSTSSVGDPIRMTLPASATAPTASQEVVGNSLATDAGVATYMGLTLLSSTTQVTPIIGNASGTYLAANTFNTTRPFTWGNTDQFRMEFMIEVD